MPRHEEFPIKFMLGLSRETEAAITEWRRKQPDLPNRSEAIRRLIEQGLAPKVVPDPREALGRTGLFNSGRSPQEEEAHVRQEQIDHLYRALEKAGHGLFQIPIVLKECLDLQVWKHERIFPGGGRQGPISFHELVHEHYPVGLGTDYTTLRWLIQQEPPAVPGMPHMNGERRARLLAMFEKLEDGQTGKSGRREDECPPPHEPAQPMLPLA